MDEFEEIKSIDDLQRISEAVVWQNFEKLAAFIFERNDFQVETNTVKTSNRKRRQYDVIARKNNRTYLVECKKWAGNRYRLSAFAAAVKQHKERSELYRNLTNEDGTYLAPSICSPDIGFFDEGTTTNKFTQI